MPPSRPADVSISRRAGDSLGLAALLLIMLCVALHFVLPASLLLYREAFSIVFACLIVIRGGVKVTSEVVAMLGFVAALSLLAILQPPTPPIYDENAVISAWQAEHPLMSQFRSALVYIPMVAYLATRGISHSEMVVIAWTMTSAAAIGLVVLVLGTSGLGFTQLALSGGGELRYLDFLPLMAFYGLGGLYLLQSEISVVARAVVSLVLLAVGLVIILSTGRQNLLWMGLTAVVFLLSTSGNTRRRVFLATVITAGLLGAAATWYVMNFGASEKLVERYGSFHGFFDVASSSSVASNSRLDLALSGCKMIPPVAWLVGVGLESCPGPGPHCDYIRQVMRGGVVFAAVAYLPFAMALTRWWRLRRRKPRSPIVTWMCCMAMFPFFFGMFGFPREDACKAFGSFLAVGLCIAFERSIPRPPQRAS
jgi:hypothetical protein